MKILYHFPSLATLSAGRTIAYGYKNAFEDLGHEFEFLTTNDDQKKYLVTKKPNIFFTSLSSLCIKFLDLELLHLAKLNGTKVFVNIPFWNSPLSKTRINESTSIKDNPHHIELLKSNKYGDIYYNVCEQNDQRMIGFEEVIGKEFQTVLLAADRNLIFPDQDDKFSADISYIGTNLPEKRQFFKNIIDPLEMIYDVRIYGQDWTFLNKSLGYAQKFGQYFNLPFLQNIRKSKLKLSDERKIYSSSIISFNVHEEYQKIHGDLNERTFKIPLAGGFEIIDNVSSLKKYFEIGKEIIVAVDNDDWREKIDFYLKNPNSRKPIIEAGRKKVMKYHTYHNRVEQIIKLYKGLK